MGIYVCNGAMCKCSFGTCPAPLVVTPEGQVTEDDQPAANIGDHIPGKNIPSFGMCSSMANPEVAAATAAAAGVLTPQPCMPVTTAPWVPGNPTVLIAGKPGLTKDSVCMCAYCGEISIEEPGQFTAQA